MAKQAFVYMLNLSKINRMATTLLAMTGDERAQLTDLLDQLENIGGQAAGFASSDIGPLRAVFAWAASCRGCSLCLLSVCLCFATDVYTAKRGRHDFMSVGACGSLS